MLGNTCIFNQRREKKCVREIKNILISLSSWLILGNRKLKKGSSNYFNKRH